MDILALAEEGKIRRIFRARNKICYPQACCHITQRAPGRELLFVEESDYLYMLHLLKVKAKKFDFTIYAFTFMPNHLHILIRLNQPNLSQAMKNICEIYARVFNKKYNRKGHVFCGSFRQALCFDDNYLLASSLYIHLNAARAGLVARPGDYRWSSCALYTENIRKDTFIEYSFILKILNENLDEARKIYQEFLEKSLSIETQQLWDSPDAVEKFRVKLFASLGSIIKTYTNITYNKLAIFDNNFLDKKIRDIKENKYSRDLSNMETRRYLVSQLRSAGYKMDEIAAQLGLSRKTIYNIINYTK